MLSKKESLKREKFSWWQSFRMPRGVKQVCEPLARAVCVYQPRTFAKIPPSLAAATYGAAGNPYQPRTLAKTSGATMVASDSIMYFGVSTLSLPQVIFSLGTAPEYDPKLVVESLIWQK
jgi:hypothetical protein